MKPLSVAPIILTLLSQHFSAATNPQDCAAPLEDRQFCNELSSVCLAAPSKACLARSVQNCLGETELPHGTLLSLRAWLELYVRGLSVPPEPLPFPVPVPDEPTGTIWE